MQECRFTAPSQDAGITVLSRGMGFTHLPDCCSNLDAELPGVHFV
jgi:hypothetical protein